MRPRIDGTEFGSITVDGETFDHDIVIRLDGRIEKRKKKLSKRQFGTSHTVSLDEAKHIFNEGARQVVIGTGQYGQVTLSDEAEAYFEKKGAPSNCILRPRRLQYGTKPKAQPSECST